MTALPVAKVETLTVGAACAETAARTRAMSAIGLRWNVMAALLRRGLADSRGLHATSRLVRFHDRALTAQRLTWSAARRLKVRYQCATEAPSARAPRAGTHRFLAE